MSGLDYTEKFALTLAASTTRMLLALAALNEMENTSNRRGTGVRSFRRPSTMRST